MALAHHLSTKERLLSIIDDIEIISKELIENTIAPKNQKISSTEHTQLVNLLVAKDEEFKSVLQLAADQAKIEQKMNVLRGQVMLLDLEIGQLQKQLKEAEQILSTALFQARQKLASIARAKKKPVPSEELIKFAHRISASHAICAPLTWQQGDLRRPYPTDIEMRLGFLGKNPDLNVNGHNMPPSQNNSLNDLSREIPASAQNQFAWHPSGELHMAMGAGSASVSLDKENAQGWAHKENAQEDVEVMSSDSSSSSSSDSQ